MIGVEPDQLPVEAESVCPTVVVPEIVGKLVDAGATWVTPVVGDVVPEPAAFETVTVTVEVPVDFPFFE